MALSETKESKNYLNNEIEKRKKFHVLFHSYYQS